MHAYVASGNTNTKYFHGDQIGTTRATSGNKGIGSGEVVYTAFGEPFSGTPESRYGYAGAYGYQAAESGTPATDPYVTDFKFLHVGARYYDPSSGRFLQRDPNGIGGGFNVYAYVLSGPTQRVDPDGTDPTSYHMYLIQQERARNRRPGIQLDGPSAMPRPPKPPRVPSRGTGNGFSVLACADLLSGVKDIIDWVGDLIDLFKGKPLPFPSPLPPFFFIPDEFAPRGTPSTSPEIMAWANTPTGGPWLPRNGPPRAKHTLALRDQWEHRNKAKC